LFAEIITNRGDMQQEQEDEEEILHLAHNKRPI